MCALGAVPLTARRPDKQALAANARPIASCAPLVNRYVQEARTGPGWTDGDAELHDCQSASSDLLRLPILNNAPFTVSRTLDVEEGVDDHGRRRGRNNDHSRTPQFGGVRVSTSVV